MPAIRQLSPSVINKIAAGEVVERPASVVKELMENALDAGAARVDVTVEQGGIELIRVVDDGGGIERDDLPLAIASHATSKLATADDLFQVRTLGFRGEALASIGEVSRMILRSRAGGGEAAAFQIEVDGGRASEVAPCGAPVGTTVEIRNLFFNTPVRRKFLRSTQTEIGHVSETFTRLALAHAKVHFTLRHNARTLYDLAPSADWRERIATFFGQEIADDLLWVDSQDGEVRLAGYVAHPSHTRSNPRTQYIFLNGRFIRDRSLQHALGEAYRGLIMTGRFPVAFLACTMPPEQVDVNVHPTKLEVRFQDAGRLYSQLLGTLRTRFLTSDLTHRLSAKEAAAPRIDSAAAAAAPAHHAKSSAGDGDEPFAATGHSRLASPMVAQPKLFGDRSNWPRGGAHFEPARGAAFEQDAPPSTRAPLTLNTVDRRSIETHSSAHATGAVSASDAAVEKPPKPHIPSPAFLTAAQRPAALQIHDRYLVAENEDGILVIDQHALHERILYEQLRERVLAGAVESQHLLVPEPVDLSASEAALVLEHRELLARLGLAVEPFGGDTVLVSAYPAMLDRAGPREVIREVVDHLAARGKAPERRDLLDEILHMVACKAAIKAGDRLTPVEIEALLAQRHLASDTHHCPHGRPTALVFTREDLDKQFKRT